MTDERRTAEPQKPSPAAWDGRRPYAPPQFHIYGNLSQLTTNTGMTGNLDGSMAIMFPQTSA